MHWDWESWDKFSFQLNFRHCFGLVHTHRVKTLSQHGQTLISIVKYSLFLKFCVSHSHLNLVVKFLWRFEFILSVKTMFVVMLPKYENNFRLGSMFQSYLLTIYQSHPFTILELNKRIWSKESYQPFRLIYQFSQNSRLRETF